MSRSSVAIVLIAIVLLSGCSGFLGASGGSGASTQHGLAVQNEYDDPRTFTVRVNKSVLEEGGVVFNRSRTLDSGELWHVGNLSAANYQANESYAIQFLVDGEVERSTSLLYQNPRPDEEGNVTWATFLAADEDGTSLERCTGSVTCYRDEE